MVHSKIIFYLLQDGCKHRDLTSWLKDQIKKRGIPESMSRRIFMRMCFFGPLSESSNLVTVQRGQFPCLSCVEAVQSERKQQNHGARVGISWDALNLMKTLPGESKVFVYAHGRSDNKTAGPAATQPQVPSLAHGEAFQSLETKECTQTLNFHLIRAIDQRAFWQIYKG